MTEKDWERLMGHMREIELALTLLVVLSGLACFLLWRVYEAVKH